MHLLCPNWDSIAIRSCPIPLNSTMSHTEGAADTLSLCGSLFSVLIFLLFLIAVDTGWSVWSSSTTSLFLCPVFITTLLYPFQPTDLLNMNWRDICIYACVSVWSKRIPGHFGKHFKCILSCSFMWSGTNCLWSKYIKPTLLPGEKRSYKDHM